MKKRFVATIITLLTMMVATFASAQEIMPMYGGVLIEGYDFAKDTGPKGTLSYNRENNELRGTYRGLKMPSDRSAIFAWVHDTVNQQSTYLGPVGELDAKGKGRFSIALPTQFKNANFGSNEIVGFTAQETGSLKGTEVVTQPLEPAGTKSLAKPAFYLFSALPGADTDRHWCGHGQDFFYAKAPDKQTCYDCKCGVKYSACIMAGKYLH